MVLDLCCGTGDMAFALQRRASRHGAKIIGADFAHPMLQRAMTKSEGSCPRWVEGDALNLPFSDSSFDLVTSAFGFRNLADYDAGLREIVRILRPDGECGILECSEPKGAVGRLYGVYFQRVLPAVGTAISGVKGPYAYLPASVRRFPTPTEMTDRMRGAGFREARWTPYTLGTAALYVGKK
jgi:demethylmenaquinone methyltransferase/2-methoxy-6-polyprenyl-1,4-benzoquinol methylase